MNHSPTLSLDSPPLPDSAPGSARMVFQLMRRLRHGTLDVQLPDGSSARFGSGDAPCAAIRLHGWGVCARALKAGDIGFAESYIDSEWTSPDLKALLDLFIMNREEFESVVYGSWWGRALYRLRHLLNRNSRRQARKNIHAHYDLGNEFYRLWLDDTMSYSSAWFDGGLQQPMEGAQRAKNHRALTECNVQPGQRLLEIGCGWGGLAEMAAREFGAQVVGVTLSPEQLAYGRARLQQAGLASRVELRLQDYRDIDDGPYDAVCSIEMFEAVGREYWDGYFAMLRRQLKPGGRACLQTITIRDDLFERYVRSTDFIQQYIFPGGLLPSPSAFRQQARVAGLQVIEELDFGFDYAETLRRWRERFLSEDVRVRKLGFDTRFMRTWEFYLAYCEAAFAQRNTSVMQFTLLRA
ncbi:cyclopropane-fatty-acyl-phospholipid synthase family protein [Schlegelella sp. S2-27]|uniref:Cyclopropane-fatty-acyl-phospholipid synthase family protein n=1 Tax=Caldimonas mangrovi TaxID=2944811 RepID=A0ABT0YKH9_9BURK|nr:cyclopropane-fatty-acyl-phospholipid synthase family protein [Caldimonas mangrovi]MCM5679239.1 cyclopropane-fatty-acyl-phospholipid synthase family protein [Caldimonas mangrovi]